MLFATALVLAACHHDPAPTKPGDLPPLPPASGTPIGYLIEGEEPQKQPGGPPPKRHNHAPGAMIKTTGDAGKLHERRKANDRDALNRAFTLLDDAQKTTARRILADRGVEAPGGSAKKETKDPDPDGVPLEP
jgi:hypothetical protein